MSTLTELSVLPRTLGEKVTYRHAGARFFVTPTSDTTWVVGRDGSGETIAILRRRGPGRGVFSLVGPGVHEEGESWMLLLATL